MALTVADIIEVYQTRATAQYGREAVNQLEHALQCAHLAEQAGEPDSLVVAALLHDMGHLLSPTRPTLVNGEPDRDDLHQHIAVPFLRGLLPDAVIEPIRLHVDAKRYLCATDRDYWASLSPASKHSLEMQGGAYNPDQCAAFLFHPFAQAAIRLRRYDDLAKAPHSSTPPLTHFQAKLEFLAADCLSA